MGGWCWTGKFCQNWDISKSRDTNTLASQAAPGEIACTAHELGCRSVAFTYNDPTIFWGYAADACHDRGIKAIAVTFVYTGNVHDAEGGSTLCPGCGSVAVIRDWYAMRHYALSDEDRCQRCGWRVAGVYDGPAGQWGRRRLPVRELSSVK